MDSAKSPAYFATRYKNNRCVLLSCLYIYKGRISSPTRLLYAKALYGVERFWFYIEWRVFWFWWRVFWFFGAYVWIFRVVFIEFYSRNDKHIPALYVAAKTSRCFIYLVLNFWWLPILVSSSFGGTLSFSQHFFARFICLCRVLLLWSFSVLTIWLFLRLFCLARVQTNFRRVFCRISVLHHRMCYPLYLLTRRRCYFCLFGKRLSVFSGRVRVRSRAEKGAAVGFNGCGI